MGESIRSRSHSFCPRRCSFKRYCTFSVRRRLPNAAWAASQPGAEQPGPSQPLLPLQLAVLPQAEEQIRNRPVKVPLHVMIYMYRFLYSCCGVR